MSVNAAYVKCDSAHLSDDEIVKGLAVVHDDERKGWRVAIITVTECDDLNDDPTCNNTAKPMSAFIRERLYLDGCGKMVMLFFNTATAS